MRIPATIFLMLICTTIHCQPLRFRHTLDSLAREGNLWYEKSNRMEIATVIGRMEEVMSRWITTGTMSHEDSLEYNMHLEKLRGDYHYENSNYDIASYAVAEQHFGKALQLLSQMPSQPKSLYIIHVEMAQLYYKQLRYADALRHMTIALTLANNLLDMGKEDYNFYLQALSLQAMCQAHNGRLGEAIDNISEAVADYSPKEGLEYEELLRKKAKLLMMRGSSQDRSNALACYKSYFTAYKKMCVAQFATMTPAGREQFWMRMRPFITDCYVMEDMDAGFLFNVTLFAKGLLLHANSSSDGTMPPADYTWQKLQLRLKANECAIEFIEYTKEDRRHMAALVLHTRGKPMFIPMTSPDSVLSYRFHSEGNVLDRITSTSRSGKDDLYRDTALRQLVWPRALLRAIGKATKVYFAPDGYQHRLAIEYMLPDDESASIEIFRLTSTRRLLTNRKTADTLQAALLCGGIDYQASSKTSLTGMGDNDDEAFRYYQQNGASFPQLLASRGEILNIREARANEADSVLLGSQATEQQFRTMCPQFNTICISTHGEMNSPRQDEGTDLKPSLNDDALSHNVIALAGVNKNISDMDFDASADMDGLLSAREMAQTDLHRCDLFVISACQTGLGEITSDGVYGIQRGLKMAGVDAMILSLWSVHDEATARLFSQFHRHLKDGMPLHRAFMQARKDLGVASGEKSTRIVFDSATMAGKSIETDGDVYDSPQYDSAFIIIDAIE